MQARLLRKLLNDTTYTISNNEGYIGIGSAYVHNLISVDKESLAISYALDHYKKGKAALDHAPLIDIWNKLEELIRSGEMHSIITGNDHIEKPLLVYHAKDGEIIETYTDQYGWPNTDHLGNLMYNNVYFKDKSEAIKQGLDSSQSWIEGCERYAKELSENVRKNNEQLAAAIIENDKYKKLLEQYK